jgi:hypothetical protein
MLIGKPEWKIPLARTKCKHVNNITIKIKKIKYDGMEWVYLV